MDSLQEENAPEAAAGAADATAGSPAETPVASSPAEAAATDGAPPRVNKRKVAMYLAYLGHGYQGMQRNPGARTIEEDLFNAIHQAGGMKDCNADERGFQKVHWARAARTDKGVSAVGQVVSLMMLPLEGIVDRINAHLPAQIRVLGFHRTVKGFDARKACQHRRYEYILPAWMFDTRVEGCPPPARQTGEAPSQQDGDTNGQDERNNGATAAAGGGGGEEEEIHAAVAAVDQDPSEQQQAGQQAAAEDPAPRSDSAAEGSAAAAPPATSFVFDDACTERLSAILRQYVGTHNFHNFTVKTPHSAGNAKRFIMTFHCSGVFEIGDQPWVRMMVTGQSFMMHQIRKMVGAAVAEFRGVAPAGSVTTALRTHGDVHVPMAPELGLFLDECCYDAYSDRWEYLHDRLTLEPYADRVAEFKRSQLYPHIAARDEAEGVNSNWLYYLTEGQFHFSTWTVQRAPPQAGGSGSAAAKRPDRGPNSDRWGKRPRQHDGKKKDARSDRAAAAAAPAAEVDPIQAAIAAEYSD